MFFSRRFAIDIDWVNANDLTAENVASRLADADGIIVPVVSVNVVRKVRFSYSLCA